METPTSLYLFFFTSETAKRNATHALKMGKRKENKEDAEEFYAQAQPKKGTNLSRSCFPALLLLFLGRRTIHFGCQLGKAGGGTKRMQHLQMDSAIRIIGCPMFFILELSSTILSMLQVYKRFSFKVCLSNKVKLYYCVYNNTVSYTIKTVLPKNGNMNKILKIGL